MKCKWKQDVTTGHHFHSPYTIVVRLISILIEKTIDFLELLDSGFVTCSCQQCNHRSFTHSYFQTNSNRRDHASCCRSFADAPRWRTECERLTTRELLKRNAKGHKLWSVLTTLGELYTNKVWTINQPKSQLHKMNVNQIDQRQLLRRNDETKLLPHKTNSWDILDK